MSCGIGKHKLGKHGTPTVIKHRWLFGVKQIRKEFQPSSFMVCKGCYLTIKKGIMRKMIDETRGKDDLNQTLKIEEDLEDESNDSDQENVPEEALQNSDEESPANVTITSTNLVDEDDEEEEKKETDTSAIEKSPKSDPLEEQFKKFHITDNDD